MPLYNFEELTRKIDGIKRDILAKAPKTQLVEVIETTETVHEVTARKTYYILDIEFFFESSERAKIKKNLTSKHFTTLAFNLDPARQFAVFYDKNEPKNGTGEQLTIF